MNPREITDVGLLQELVVELLNQQGEVKEALAASQKQLQEALDEIRRLKGEKPRPRFPSSRQKIKVKKLPKTKDTSSKPEADSSSESAPSAPPVDRVEIVDAKPEDLPSDAQFKGYRSVYQRDIQIVRDNVEYRIARWYSPSMGKHYEAALPSDYRGQTGSRLVSFMQILHHCGDMTHQRIADLLNHLGIELSTGGISNILTHSDWVTAEQDALLASSIGHSPFVQMDNTTSKQKGQRRYTQIICGKHFSLFYTLDGRSRLDVYAALQGQSRQEVRLAYTELALERLIEAKVSKMHLEYFEKTWSLDQELSMQDLEAIFFSVAIFSKTNQIRRSAIAGALAAGYYHQQAQMPTVSYMMTDDAREYKGVARKKHIHCWIHAIRHYRVMNPTIEYHRNIYAAFMDKLWAFYERIKAYKDLTIKKRRSEKRAIMTEFDTLFSASTDYKKLNEQMAKTHTKRDHLLAFIDYPDFPLHNNAAERGARRVVRKRDISFHTWSERGTRIRDAFMSLHQTANKIGVRFLDYLVDRNSGTYAFESMATQVSNAYLRETATF